jgi:hypothetical protein
MIFTLGPWVTYLRSKQGPVSSEMIAVAARQERL